MDINTITKVELLEANVARLTAHAANVDILLQAFKVCLEQQHETDQSLNDLLEQIMKHMGVKI